MNCDDITNHVISTMGLSFCSSFQFSLEWKWAWIYTIALSEVLEYHRANGALVIMTYIGDSRTLSVLSTFYCVFHLFHFMRALITRSLVFSSSDSKCVHDIAEHFIKVAPTDMHKHTHPRTYHSKGIQTWLWIDTKNKREREKNGVCYVFLLKRQAH